MLLRVEPPPLMNPVTEAQPPSLKPPIAAVLLSIVLALFLADAAVSLLDDLLHLGGLRILGGIRGLTGFFCFLTGIVTYIAIGLTPLIPKRIFLPVTLLGPVVVLSLPLLSIYYFARMPVLAMGFDVIQIILGLGIVHSTQGGFRLRWPLIRAEHLGTKLFSAWNLIGFVAVNLGLLLPGVVLYLSFCAHLAVGHFSGGFLGLYADGLSSTAKTYVRADGKELHLIPMMHIGDSKFYEELSRSFPTNSIILLEGVTDVKHHLENKLSYKRVADSLGLEEQHDNFEPTQGLARQADVDVDQFAATTLELLNLFTLIHTKGPSLALWVDLMSKGQDPRLAEQLWRDLLTLRNEHLLKEIRIALTETGTVMVPWGAAHMPGLAQEIQNDGFKLSSSHKYQIVNFRAMWERVRNRKK